MVKGKRAKVSMVTYRDDSLWSMIRDVATFMTLHGKADTVTGLKHNFTGINTFGVPIMSKEVLIGLVEKTKAGALDDVISRLTTTAHSDDTPSEEPNRDIIANTSLNLSDLKFTSNVVDAYPNSMNFKETTI
nr:hypothetical protein [Tanacetum cinerariifolium]